MPSPEGDHIMDSAFIHQAANELVQTAGTRNIKQIARSCSLDISETSRIKDMLGLLSLYFDKPLILINRQLDKQTKQMVCGYALGHYLEHQLLMDLHTLNKFLTIKDKHILLYEHNAFTSHLMLDSDEVYQMTKRGLDAAQIAAAKGIHLNLVLVKLLELHHLGYDLRHYHAQHHAFIKQFNLPAHFQFDVAAG
jgi:Zn-dependent peptidase ImmA (M78 family)